MQITRLVFFYYFIKIKHCNIVLMLFIITLDTRIGVKEQKKTYYQCAKEWEGFNNYSNQLCIKNLDGFSWQSFGEKDWESIHI